MRSTLEEIAAECLRERIEIWLKTPTIKFSRKDFGMKDQKDATELEYEAWKDLCTALKELTGYDVSDPRYNNLISYIKIWGRRFTQSLLTKHEKINKQLVRSCDLEIGMELRTIVLPNNKEKE